MTYDRILFDIEAQRDFFSPGGACYDASTSLPSARNIRTLFRWARQMEIPVLSTVLRVRPGRLGPLAKVPHCIDGSEGEKRISGTLLSRHIDLGIRNSTDLPGDLFEQYQQVIIEKRHPDIFKHARAERLMTELDPKTFIVCGAGTAQSILQAVVGMRHRGFEIVLASDAIVDLDDPDAEMAWLRMIAKGAKPMTTEEIIAPVRQSSGSRSAEALRARFRQERKALTG